MQMVRPMAQKQFNVLLFLGGTQDEAHRLVFALAPFVLFEPGEIQVHLPFVSGGKRPNFEVNRHQAAQKSMIEQEVEPVIVVVNPHGKLAGDEAKR